MFKVGTENQKQNCFCFIYLIASVVPVKVGLDYQVLKVKWVFLTGFYKMSWEEEMWQPVDETLEL